MHTYIPTAKEKIEAFLNGKSLELMTQFNAIKPQTIKEFWKDVNFEDIRKYADEYGVPESFCFHKENTADGLYLIKENNSWLVFNQEHGIRDKVQEYSNEKDALYGALLLTYTSQGGII